MTRKLFTLFACIFSLFYSLSVNAEPSKDPLPSWNPGPVKESILRFVETVTDQTNPNYVPPQDRIATFDNDGTLWLEQPLYTQEIFVLDRIKALYSKHPEWKNQKPFSLILSGNKEALKSLTAKDMMQLIAVTHTNITTDNFEQIAKDWLAQAKNPRFQHVYTDLIYQPMLEVINYLRANNFAIYIVTGGGKAFVRAFSDRTYHVPTERVIGSTFKTKYTYQANKPELIILPDILFVNDKTGKPEAINLFIGKKPIIAFGNSDGDREMLEWTQSGSGQRLMLLVHHDDAKREYAYGPASKVGTFSNALMQEAMNEHWQVISMKNDWKVIFPFEQGMR